jgi:hypothetical protein
MENGTWLPLHEKGGDDMRRDLALTCHHYNRPCESHNNKTHSL